MNKFYLFLALIITINTFGQEKTYTFSKNRLIQVRKFSDNINPLNLKPISISIVRFDTVKTVTNEYARILKENEKFKNDSIKEVQNYNSNSIEYNKLKSIVSNLKLFLNSTEKFKVKKEYLIIAQKVSDSLTDKNIISSIYGQKSVYDKGFFSSLIFSDNEFNSEFKNEFKEINSSEKNLKDYILNKISIISQIREPIFKWKRKDQFSEITYYRLDPNPKKYDLKFEKKDTISLSGFQGIHFDYLNLSGTFIVINNFYQKEGNNHIYLLKSKDVKNINIGLNGFYEIKNLNQQTDWLLQNIDTKEYIICNNSLLYEYEETKSDEDFKKFNDGYLIWKAKYLGLSKSAQNNVANCYLILKRNTFINVLGQSVWNADKISKKDKIDFNNNYDLITEKLNKLGTLEQESEFLNKYIDSAKGNEGIEVYGVSLFHSKAVKFNID